MLFLRRYVGEKLILLDGEEELLIDFISIDPKRKLVELKIDGVSMTMRPRTPIGFFRGMGTLRFDNIQTFVDGRPPFVSIGIAVPRTVRILREELLRGTTPAERAAMSF